MVIRNTGYTTNLGEKIFSENGEFYYTNNISGQWNRVPDRWHYYTEMRLPSGERIYVSTKQHPNVGQLKRTYNKAARKIQTVYRRYRSAKRAGTRKSSPKRSPYKPRSMRKIPNTRVGNNNK